MFHIGWERTTAKLIDQVRVRKDAYQSEMGGRTPFEVWDYMVEVTGRDGQPTRLVIREKSFEVKLPPIGQEVPVLVNRRRTKAAFDMDDPVISTRMHQKAAAARREERDAARRARFEERRDGRD